MNSGPNCKALESGLTQSKFISNQASHELFSPTLLHQTKGGLLYQQQPMQQQHGFLSHSNNYQETYYLDEGAESVASNTNTNNDVYSACAPNLISEASVGNVESQQQPAYNYNRDDAWSANLHAGPFASSYDNHAPKGLQQDFNNNNSQQEHQQQSGEQYQQGEASSYSSAQTSGNIQPHVLQQRLIQGQPFANIDGFYATQHQQNSYECSTQQQQFCANNNNSYQNSHHQQQQQQQYQQQSGSPTSPLEQPTCLPLVDSVNHHSSQQQHDQVDQQNSLANDQCSSRNSNNTLYALNSSGLHDYRSHQQICQSSSNSQYQDDFSHQANYASSGSNSGCSSSTQYNLNNNFNGLSNIQQSVSSEDFLNDHYEVTTSPDKDALSQTNILMCTNKTRLIKSRRGRPRKKGLRSKNKVNGKLWEFIRDLLLSERTNPSFIRWERREDGVFKFVQSDKVAKMWGERKQNPKMTYEKLSRAMRYYYKSKVLLPVFGRRLVYKFGPNATGWLPDE